MSARIHMQCIFIYRCDDFNLTDCFVFLFLLQFSTWVDAVIFVFSLENEASFNAVYNFYTKMTHFRNSSEIPIILVGTQGLYHLSKHSSPSHTKHQLIDNLLFYFFKFKTDAINDRSPRVIDEARARKLANDLKRCTYFETCATYGLNVDSVFQEGRWRKQHQCN